MTPLRLFFHIFLFKCVFEAVVDADCPEGAIEGFTEEGTAACYLYERFETQFLTAERLCRMSGGHLASISDGFVNDFIAQEGVEAFEVMGINNFWIGGNDLKKRGDWEWVDGNSWQYSNWASNESVNDSRNSCAAISLPEGLWYSKSCYESKPYVCEVPSLPLHTTTNSYNDQVTSSQWTAPQKYTTPRSVSNCEDGWSYLKTTNRCYKIVNDTDDCYRANIQEASIHSKTENEFIGKLAQKAAGRKNISKIRLSAVIYRPSKESPNNKDHSNKADKAWSTRWEVQNAEKRRQSVGLFDKHKKHGRGSSSSSEETNNWIWRDGTQFDFSNWGKNEPKKPNKYNCAQLNTDKGKFEWSSTDCTKPDYAVCSQPSVASGHKLS